MFDILTDPVFKMQLTILQSTAHKTAYSEKRFWKTNNSETLTKYATDTLNRSEYRAQHPCLRVELVSHQIQDHPKGCHGHEYQEVLQKYRYCY